MDNFISILIALISGGLITQLIKMVFDEITGKKKSIEKIHDRINMHEELDNNRFDDLKSTMNEKHIEMLQKMNTMGSDISFIKGKIEK
ncbi:MAG: hypothetical protein ACRDFB_03260 [Rhabdochlamydiaceae bacterium]